MEVVGEADTVSEAVRRVAFEEPDVVTLDVDLPDGSGIDACAAIRAISPRTKILILTAYADPRIFERARAEGADGFVLKRAHDFRLLEEIRRVVAGEKAFDDGPQKRPEDPLLSRLTPREISILELIAEGLTTGRSPTGCAWRRRRSRTTSPTSWRRWASATERLPPPTWCDSAPPRNRCSLPPTGQKPSDLTGWHRASRVVTDSRTAPRRRLPLSSIGTWSTGAGERLHPGNGASSTTCDQPRSSSSAHSLGPSRTPGPITMTSPRG